MDIGLLAALARRASAFMPIEIGLLRRWRAKRRPSPTQGMFFRSAQADRWPKVLAPMEIGLLRRLRARRRPSPTQGMFFRSAQADRWPKVFQPSEALARQASAFADARDVFSVGAGRPMAEGLGAD
jgi:hypothetical protein